MADTNCAILEASEIEGSFMIDWPRQKNKI